MKRLLIVGRPDFLPGLDRLKKIHTVIRTDYEGAVARFYAEKPDISVVAVTADSDMAVHIIQYFKLAQKPCLAVIISHQPSAAMLAASNAGADQILVNPGLLDVAAAIGAMSEPMHQFETKPRPKQEI